MKFASNRHRASSQAAVGTRLLLACAVATALLMGVMPLAHAQTPPANTQRAEITFDVPAGALDQALVRFGRQSGLQFSINSSLTRGKRTAGLKGTYHSEDGLRALLSGSGLTFRFTGPRNVVIEPMPETGDARVLGPLRIEGAAGNSGLAGAGVNGSTDPTATENSGTYAASATTFVSKTAQSALDTAQTVSVISRQQLSDQNINDFRSAMENAPGITVIPGGHSQDIQMFSRGFEIQKVRIDGGSPVRIGGGAYTVEGNFFRPNFDMALYDHIEILRGADGMFSGYGLPGGVINLTRKRPLESYQTLLELETGSWDYKRSVIDVTGPLSEDGSLRGRAVATYTDRDYFYDRANDTATTVYGVVEKDIADDLVLRLGISMSSKSGLPWVGGLPRFETGDDLGLGRNTCFCFGDMRFSTVTDEYFIQSDYSINESWSLNANLSKFFQRNEEWGTSASGPVNPTTGRGFGTFLIWGRDERDTEKLNADVSVNGEFNLFGKQQKLSFGLGYSKGSLDAMDWRSLSYGTAAYFGMVPGIPASDPNYGYVDVFNFDPNDARYQPLTPELNAYYDEGNEEYTSYLGYSSEIVKNLTLNLGVRYSHYESHGESSSFCRPAPTVRTCDVYRQNEAGEWVVVGSIGAGEKFPIEKIRRRDVDSNFSWPPSISLVYKMTDSVSMYASYTDVYISNGNLVDERKNTLPPTVGFNTEFGANYLGLNGQLAGKASIYYIKQKDIPEELYRDEAWSSANEPRSCCHYIPGNQESTSYGLDLEVNGKVTNEIQISASYNFNRNKFVHRAYDYQAPAVSRAPEHMLKIWATYQVPESDSWWSRMSFGAGVRAQTDTFESGSVCTDYIYGTDPATGQLTATCSERADFDFTQGSYAVYSARAAYRLNDAWVVSLNVENAGDKVYYSRTSDPNGGNWYGEPRSYALVLRGKF